MPALEEVLDIHATGGFAALRPRFEARFRMPGQRVRVLDLDGSEQNRCNVCNIGLCPKGITSQNPKLYRRLDPDLVAERVANTFMAISTEMKKIMAPLGRSQSLPIGMSDAIGIDDPFQVEMGYATWGRGYGSNCDHIFISLRSGGIIIVFSRMG